MTIAVGQLEVRGGATPEELAAVLALVAQLDRTSLERSRYETWRARRLAALRATSREASGTLMR